ncbi:hypothetical protein [Rhizorhabdus sp. FW153]|uniref:hypothetical protein n=1 Tax=Rhizorhabdus sp. FW153 TaxID=3400216 RepID=UPI003CF73946
MKPTNSGSIAWLREIRRSAWLLIGLCVIYRIGGFMIDDISASLQSRIMIAQVQP